MRVLSMMFAGALVLLISCTTNGSSPQELPSNIVPTPKMAMVWAMGKDTKNWELKKRQGNSHGILAEFLATDETFDHWSEMVIHFIDFQSNNSRKIVEIWKAGLVESDPKIEIQQLAEVQGSILMYYYSDAQGRGGVRKFVSGDDAVYSLTFEFKREVYDKDRLEWWMRVIAGSSLIENPARK